MHSIYDGSSIFDFSIGQFSFFGLIDKVGPILHERLHILLSQNASQLKVFWKTPTKAFKSSASLNYSNLSTFWFIFSGNTNNMKIPLIQLNDLSSVENLGKEVTENTVTLHPYIMIFWN